MTTQQSICRDSGSVEAPWRKSFWSLIVTQFQGAFSDVTLKNLVIFMIMGMGLPTEKRDQWVAVVGALFSLPFILFSMAGGHFADRYSKRSVTVAVKVFEIGVMAFALVALIVQSLPLQLTAVFFMGVHSAIFGPSKYGLLPELLPESRLSWGNGVVELGTFVAIICGTMAGAAFSDVFRGRQVWSGVILITLALFGVLVSRGIARVPAADPAKQFRLNFLSDLWSQVRTMQQDRVLWLAVLGNAFFFFIAALLQLNIIIYGQDILHLDQTRNGYLQAAIAIGIGTGSLAAGYLSGGKIEYGLIPLGAIGLTGFAAILGAGTLSFGGVLGTLALLGFFGGFFIVPISALLQHRPAAGSKGAMLAASNLISWIGVFMASGIYYLSATVLHLSPHGIFLWSAAVTAVGTIYVLFLLPDALVRFLLWILTHTVYRVRVEGRENIPAKGGALFVCNHLSFVDALLVMASTDRFVRFILFRDIYEHWLLKPFARIMGAIPISSQLRPREMIASLRAASEAIQRGEVVCIFAEGQISRIGQMLPFRRGLERIMKGVEAPIVPICLDGVWGSIFSFDQGRFVWKLPRQIPYPVSVCYGKPLPGQSTPVQVRQAVQELHCEAARLRKRTFKPLHRSFITTGRRYPFRFAMADAQVPFLNFFSALTRALFLARRFRKPCADQEHVGLLLPPSVGGALSNFALLLMGKVPVHLNYTLSEEAIASCIAQCGIKTVISSSTFLERMKFKVPVPVLKLEELIQDAGWDRFMAALSAVFLPARWLERSVGCRRRIGLDDLATVIFSSGSTGDPKGVMLTHYNIASNVQQFDQVFALRPSDRILGVLPFFHSFGFTATLALPALVGVGAVYHPNPLDTKAIGPLVRTQRVTFLLTTPTFLQMYVRGCEPEDFGSLRFVLAGAEKLSERAALAFEEKFGVRPVEAYGCTECSPGVSVSTHDYRAAGFRQVGAKRGKIGHPLPGVSVRVVDPESLEPVSIGQPGLLLVRGPNLMKGYLGRPEATEKVFTAGWYITGDIAMLDEDGFLQITDRLSRFSKIGGEMVPHVKVEETLQGLVELTDRGLVVTGVPDEKKGERLVVLHVLDEVALQRVFEKLAGVDLPNLWIPRTTHFFRLETLPYLGTGKLDLRKIRELALQFSASVE